MRVGRCDSDRGVSVRKDMLAMMGLSEDDIEVSYLQYARIRSLRHVTYLEFISAQTT